MTFSTKKEETKESIKQIKEKEEKKVEKNIEKNKPQINEEEMMKTLIGFQDFDTSKVN